MVTHLYSTPYDITVDKSSHMAVLGILNQLFLFAHLSSPKLKFG